MGTTVEKVRKNLRAARESNNLSRSALASRLGYHHNTLYLWERGEREISLSDLEKVSQELGVTVEWLVSGSDATSGKEGEAALVSVPVEIWRTCAAFYQAYLKNNPSAPKLPHSLTDCPTLRSHHLSAASALDMVALAQFAQLALTA